MIVWHCLVEVILGLLCVSKKEGESMNTAFVLFSLFTLKHVELQSINFEPPIPLMPFDIVMYAFTPL